MEDNVFWKTTFHRRYPSMGVNLPWRTNLMEHGLWWKTPLMEDRVKGKTKFYGTHPASRDKSNETHSLLEDKLWWKTTFDGGQFLLKDYLEYKIIRRHNQTSMNMNLSVSELYFVLQISQPPRIAEKQFYIQHLHMDLSF